jgi:hypothetical protein
MEAAPVDHRIKKNSRISHENIIEREECFMKIS